MTNVGARALGNEKGIEGIWIHIQDCLNIIREQETAL